MVILLDKNAATVTLQSQETGNSEIHSIYISFKENLFFFYIDSETRTLGIENSKKTSTNSVEQSEIIKPSSDNIIIFNSENGDIKYDDCIGEKSEETPSDSECVHTMSISNIYLHKKFITAKDINYTAVCKYDPSNDTNQNICKERCIKTKDCTANVCNSICSTISKVVKKPTSDDPEPQPPKK